MNGEQLAMRSALGDMYDRTFRILNDRADVVKTGPRMIQHVHPVLEITTNYSVQTARVRDPEGNGGDTIFLTVLGTEGSTRIALPPDVADCIARQREALSKRVRKASARESMRKRMAGGWKPSFGPKGGRGKRKKKRKAKPEADAKEGG